MKKCLQASISVPGGWFVSFHGQFWEACFVRHRESILGMSSILTEEFSLCFRGTLLCIGILEDIYREERTSLRAFRHFFRIAPSPVDEEVIKKAAGYPAAVSSFHTLREL